jgi:hypothetical protein
MFKNTFKRFIRKYLSATLVSILTIPIVISLMPEFMIVIVFEISNNVCVDCVADGGELEAVLFGALASLLDGADSPTTGDAP